MVVFLEVEVLDPKTYAGGDGAFLAPLQGAGPDCGRPWVASIMGPGGPVVGCDPRLCSSIPLGWWLLVWVLLTGFVEDGAGFQPSVGWSAFPGATLRFSQAGREGL
jgi:hypothetical protein